MLQLDRVSKCKLERTANMLASTADLHCARHAFSRRGENDTICFHSVNKSLNRGECYAISYRRTQQHNRCRDNGDFTFERNIARRVKMNICVWDSSTDEHVAERIFYKWRSYGSNRIAYTINTTYLAWNKEIFNSEKQLMFVGILRDGNPWPWNVFSYKPCAS